MLIENSMYDMAINLDSPKRNLNCAFAFLNIVQLKFCSGLSVILGVIYIHHRDS